MPKTKQTKNKTTGGKIPMKLKVEPKAINQVNKSGSGIEQLKMNDLCQCVKKDGSQCTRSRSKKLLHDSSFCYQHQNCQNVLKMTKQPSPKQLNAKQPSRKNSSPKKPNPKKPNPKKPDPKQESPKHSSPKKSSPKHVQFDVNNVGGPFYVFVASKDGASIEAYNSQNELVDAARKWFEDANDSFGLEDHLDLFLELAETMNINELILLVIGIGKDIIYNKDYYGWIGVIEGGKIIK